MDVRRLLIVSLCLAFLAAPITRAQNAASSHLIVCFGDSITAGYRLPAGQAYSDNLQRELNTLGYHYNVLNRGTSGATTKDAVVDLPSILRLHPAIVIVEFGGNDGLRGLPLSATQQNLDKVVGALVAAHIKVLVAGITLPPNYGPDYIRQFNALFPALARKYRTALVPMIYKDLVHVPGTIQDDGIHPTAKGSRIIAKTLLPALKPLLRK
ncbi:MAG: arylesterase [Acidobacteriota bacterium]|nr:arylesterase [Acidobacteriota bacterium]